MSTSTSQGIWEEFFTYTANLSPNNDLSVCLYLTLYSYSGKHPMLVYAVFIINMS